MNGARPLEEIIEFAENPEPRCPCVLLLDTSGSMHGAPLDALNEGLRTFRDNLCRDTLAARRVEVAIVTFDSEVRVVQDFVTADLFEPPVLTARGMTHIGSAIHTALDMVQARKAQYRSGGIAYYRPWVFLITDGAPQGEAEGVVEDAARRVAEEEADKRVAFFAVGGVAAELDATGVAALEHYGRSIGLAFQIMDDVLDVTSTTKAMGKTTGRDAVLGKSTYPALLGVDGARRKAQALIEDALRGLADHDLLTQELSQVANFMVTRTS